MNIEMLRVIKRQLLEVVGVLALADDKDEVIYAKQRLIGVIHGLQIVIEPHETKPTTLDELEQKQFDRAKSVDEEALQALEQDATWGH